MTRWIYCHDGHYEGPTGPCFSCDGDPTNAKDWVETAIRWDDPEKCYVVTIKTNDVTNASRWAAMIPWGLPRTAIALKPTDPSGRT